LVGRTRELTRKKKNWREIFIDDGLIGYLAEEITESRIQVEILLSDSRPLYSYSDWYGLQMVTVSAR